MTREQGIIKAYTENGPAVKARSFPSNGRNLITAILDTEYNNYAEQCELYCYEQPLPKSLWLNETITPKTT
jgi:hypothetical protein